MAFWGGRIYRTTRNEAATFGDVRVWNGAVLCSALGLPLGKPRKLIRLLGKTKARISTPDLTRVDKVSG